MTADNSRRTRSVNPRWLFAILALAVGGPGFAQEKEERKLRWGTDPTGGGPYIYKDDPNGPYVGFEVELAEYLAKKLGRASKLVEADWRQPSRIARQAAAGREGHRHRPQRLRAPRRPEEAICRPRVPYYVYRLQLVAHGPTTLGDGAGLICGPKREAHRCVSAGRSRSSTAPTLSGGQVDLKTTDVATMFNGLVEQTHARRDRSGQPGLHVLPADPKYAGRSSWPTRRDNRVPTSSTCGRDDKELRELHRRGDRDGFKDGTLRRSTRSTAVWNDDQEWLCIGADRRLAGGRRTPDRTGRRRREGYDLAADSATPGAAGMTVFLAVASFPLAM